MKTNKTLIVRLLCAAMLVLGGVSQTFAWDSEPDSEGLYDGLFLRPTYYPDWSQPSTWPNAMYYRCEVEMGVSGPLMENYEIAVFDQNNVLRNCNRSLTSEIDGVDRCVLTIRGEEGDTFHFQIIYGDIDNPTIYDVPEVTVPFNTNQIVGSDTPFRLTVPGRLILNETDASTLESKTDADVTVMRTINAGEWSTICLPFAIPADQLETAFGTKMELGDFKGYEVNYEEDEVTVKSINVKFDAATAIEANHPYIIKVQDNVTEINIDGVDIITDEDPIVAAVKRTRKQWSEIIGNYENGFLVPDQTLFLSGGKFWYSVGKTPMMAYRAYFDFYDMLPEIEYAEARISMTFDGSDQTGVQFVAMPTQKTTQLYDLQGRKVTSHLMKGIYINNGKKILVK